MCADALKIGVSACFFHADPKRPIFKGKTLLYMEESLGHWIQTQGALPFLIPTAQHLVEPSDIIRELDGLVLQGGSDVSPKSYGEEAINPDWEGDYIRDQYEIELIKECMDQDKPILGVCRGAEIINVALGGKLFQDIKTQNPEACVHRDWNVYDQLFHDIEIVAGTRLALIYRDHKPRRVNSIHHQGIKDLGKDLVAEAYSVPDKIIEAVRLKSEKAFVFGVQWHPEFQDAKDTSLFDTRPLLNDFLKEVRRRK